MCIIYVCLPLQVVYSARMAHLPVASACICACLSVAAGSCKNAHILTMHGRTYPGNAGCSKCPEGQYPYALWHRLSGTPESESWGTVECSSPIADGSSHVKTLCYPFYSSDLIHEHRAKMPTSCRNIGIVRNIIGVGKSWNSHVQWDVGCLLWKVGI